MSNSTGNLRLGLELVLGLESGFRIMVMIRVRVRVRLGLTVTFRVRVPGTNR